MRVVKQEVLHLPADMQADQDRVWLKAGGVVDMDDPFTRHAVKGQEYKLEDASDNAAVTPLIDGRLLNYREKWIDARKKRRAARRRALEQDLDPGEELDGDDETDLDEDDDDAGEGKKEPVTATAGGQIQKPDKSKRAARTDKE